MLTALQRAVRYPARRLVRHAPANARLLRALYRARFEEWCRVNPCREFSDREALYEHLASSALTEPLTFLEFGVYRGESIQWWAGHFKHPASTFIGFDWFEGLPETWHRDRPKGTFSTGGALPDVSDARVTFVKGLFHETLPTFVRTFEAEHRLVVHCDADLFGSTLLVLMTVAPLLRRGDVLLFDEFCYPLHEFRALEETSAAFPLELRAIARTPGYRRVALQVASWRQPVGVGGDGA